MRNVKLLSVIGDCDLDLLPSFLEHFLSKDIRAENFLVTYHSAVQCHLEPGLDIFYRFGIEPKVVWTGPWVHPTELQDSKLFYLSLMRKRHSEEEDWLVYADTDEHHQYSLPLESMIDECEKEGFDYVSGIWIDRLSRDGTLAAVDSSTPLETQYPIGTVISKEIFQKRRKSITKMMLARRNVIPQNAGFHQPKDNHWKCHPQKMFVHHFKWTDKVLFKMQQRAKGWYASDGQMEAVLFLDYCQKNSYRVPIHELAWSYDFEGPLNPTNLLNTAVMSQARLNQAVFEQISWINSFKREASVDVSERAIPWYTFPCIRHLASVERRLTGLTLFEYGGGQSTLYFAKHCKEVVTVEHSKEWHSALIKVVPANVDLRHIGLTVDGEYAKSIAGLGKKFDIICIDGRDRVNCLKRALPHLNEGGVIIFDDADREEYRSGLDWALTEGFTRKYFKGLSPGDLNRNSITAVLY